MDGRVLELGSDDRSRGAIVRGADVGGTEAHWAVVTVDTLVDVMRGPARYILEESDAADAAVVA